MKKLFFFILFLGINILTFGSNVYFLNDGQGYIYTNGQTFNSGSSGRALIAYHLWADPVKYSVDEWGAKFQDPDGNWSDWGQMSASLGLLKSLKAGTWHVKGRVHVHHDIYGYSDYYMYTSFTLNFDVVDNIAPSIPQSLSSTSQNNHPRITWTANTEYDMSYYEIYKSKNSPVYTYYDQTVNNYYVDLSEFLYGIGEVNKTYVYYKIKAVDVNANKSDLSSNTHAVVNGAIEKRTMLNEESTLNVFKLFDNYPNPYNPSTTISYQVPKGSYVTLKVFNTLGKEMAELVNGFEEPGRYSIIFDAGNLPSGMYFYKFQAGIFTDVKKMILTK